jgi:hypothetical protein
MVWHGCQWGICMDEILMWWSGLRFHRIIDAFLCQKRLNLHLSFQCSSQGKFLQLCSHAFTKCIKLQAFYRTVKIVFIQENTPQTGTLNCIITPDNYLHHFIITVLTEAGADRFSFLLGSMINRWTSACWEVRCWEAKQSTQCSSPLQNADLSNRVLFLRSQTFEALPDLDTDESVNFASAVEFFYPGTLGNRQVPNYLISLLPNNTYSYQSPHSIFLLQLLHLGCTNKHRSIPFVYLLLV